MPTLKLVGAYASPYTRKMRAVLRFRRLPFQWIVRGSEEDAGIPPVPVNLIPVLVFADGEAMIDSTFQIRRLEALYPDRSIVPSDPALAFLAALVEDYADEWLTKPMFHYRWAYAPDIARASRVLPLDARPALDAASHTSMADAFARRQIDRLAVVGSNPTTAPVIEASYRRLLSVLDARFASAPFVFGTRPATADFGLFGQLSQLALFDPTPAAIAVDVAPRVIAWANRMDDLSSLEVDGWATRDAVDLSPLLAEIGRTYAPFLLANADALAAGAPEVNCEIDGTRWVQRSFPYQGKCLRWLREAHAALAADDRRWVDDSMAGSGCERLFA
jgi:glutathione S-transferase